ncbi:MAG: YybH family protein [Gammaproteobacteria bacterium]
MRFRWGENIVNEFKFLAGRFLLLFVMLWLAACASPSEPVVEPESEINLEQLRESLLQQDLRFSEVSAEVGIAEAYRRFMAQDAISLPDGGLAIGGRDEIYEEMRTLSEGMEFVITWEPLEVEVAASGELGFTWGIYYFEALDELGAPYVAEGKYVYLWRNNNGRWELILDMTNETEPAYEIEIAEPEIESEATGNNAQEP